MSDEIVNSFDNPAAALKLLNRKPTLGETDKVVLPTEEDEIDEEMEGDDYYEGGEDAGEEGGDDPNQLDVPANAFENPAAALAKHAVLKPCSSPLIVPGEAEDE